MGGGQPDAARTSTRGVERADSWATDAHKWLNVPYDGGLAIVADRAAHRARDGPHRRLSGRGRAARQLRLHARGVAARARLRALRRAALARPRGVAELVERNCAQAARFAELLRDGGAEILNDVVLNQVLVAAPPERRRARSRPTARAGSGGTVWRGREAMRISVSDWATTDADVERSARAILSAITSL